jgi:hypothetical protein
MSIQKTIRQVISEHKENKKSLIEETKIIKKRFKFILEGYDLNSSRQKTKAFSKLQKERRHLVNIGFNQSLVKESFIDVMGSLYSGEGKDVLGDVKTKLGERIASSVQNKAEEHQMILDAFNELDSSVVEKAIKEKRVDELSDIISKKALEKYKTDFGEEGLIGSMISSVDPSKFKSEVAKLVAPAIDDITSKMDQKLQQVKDAVKGIGS